MNTDTKTLTRITLVFANSIRLQFVVIREIRVKIFGIGLHPC